MVRKESASKTGSTVGGLTNSSAVGLKAGRMLLNQVAFVSGA
jgi:hypothetical protein